MKLKSGHTVVEVPEEVAEENKRLFKGHSLGVVKLVPGDWFFTRPFVDIADKIYEFEFRSSDTVIMTFPKCGTTWLQEIIWFMKHPSDLDGPPQGVSINTRCPFIEFDFIARSPTVPPMPPDSDTAEYIRKYCPDLDPKEGVFIQLAKSVPDPRIIKTHLSFSLMPPNILHNSKVVFVARNPKDVCLSFYYHNRIIKGHLFTGNFDQFFEMFLKDEVHYGPYWRFLQEGLERRKDPNFHFIFFEDLKTEPVKEITRLNEFLGTGLSQEILEKVAEETSFKKMKERNTFLGYSKREWNIVDISQGSFFRSGTAGGWKNELTEEQSRRINEIIIKKYPKEIVDKYL